MPVPAIETLLEPYGRYVRANMELMTRYPLSVAFALPSPLSPATPGAAEMPGLPQLGAFVDFFTALAKNTMDLWTDLGRGLFAWTDFSPLAWPPAPFQAAGTPAPSTAAVAEADVAAPAPKPARHRNAG